MQGVRPHQPEARRLWLFAGTGEGPPLAAALQRQGWRLRVSVVTPEAARAYAGLEDLELAVGALEGAETLARQLRQAAAAEDPVAVVVDATHPFALEIQASLAAACGALAVPLLRLERRAWSPQPGTTLLSRLERLSELDLAGSRLLLAIGARQLAAAVNGSPGAVHHARLLPTPFSLQQAMAAGLRAERVACLRPTESGWIETALIQRWQIDVILARQSGGAPEGRWQRIAAEQGCRLLLLRRPSAGHAVPAFTQEALLRQLAQGPGP